MLQRRHLLLLALSTIALPPATLLAQFPGARDTELNPSRYGWLPSLEQGKAAARKDGRPLMVVVRCVP